MDGLLLDWLALLQKRFTGSEHTVCDIGQKIQFLTVDIITRICLGDEVGCSKHDQDVYRILETVEVGNKVCQYLSIFLELNTLLFHLGRIPAMRKCIFPSTSDSNGVGRLMGVKKNIFPTVLRGRVDMSRADCSQCGRKTNKRTTCQRRCQLPSRPGHVQGSD
jgi:hypothetical protein